MMDTTMTVRAILDLSRNLPVEEREFWNHVDDMVARWIEGGSSVTEVLRAVCAALEQYPVLTEPEEASPVEEAIADSRRMGLEGTQSISADELEQRLGRRPTGKEYKAIVDARVDGIQERLRRETAEKGPII